MTFDLDAELVGAVTTAAQWRDMAVEEYIRQAVAEIAARDAAEAAFIQEGIDDLNAGRTYTQEQVEQWFEARHRHIAAE